MDNIQRDIKQIIALEKDHKSILVALRAYWVNNFYSLSEIDKKILTDEISYYRVLLSMELLTLLKLRGRV